MLEFLWLLLFDLFLTVPGAFIVWSWGGFRASYGTIIDNDQNRCALIGFAFWVIVFAVTGLVARAI